MKLLHEIRQLPPSSHICAFYDTASQRLDALAAYCRVGLERGDLCVFVTSQKTAQLIRQLKDKGLNIEEAINNRQLKILPMKGTYLPDGTFKSFKMLDNLRDFVKDCKKRGYPGLRTGGDMDWLAEKAPGWQEVSDYEAKINRFIRGSNFTGICFFPTGLFDSDLVQKIIQTHQWIIRNDELYANPYYVAPEKFFKMDISLVSQLETWLDSMEEKDRKVHNVVADLVAPG